ncbi:MAG: NAD(P)/FAD-dependent oxidoreductase, partial [Solirubrobacterales bacterium]
MTRLREGPAPEGPFDVAVVGAGAVGCAVARDLSRRGARCALIEAAPDVGAGTSKANTAILHTGFDAKPGTIESGLVARGYELLSEYAEQTGIPNARLGALMVAWSGEQRDALPGIEAKARENGYEEARPVDLEELYAREPNLGRGAEGALEIPGEGIVCPFTATLAYATEAVAAGCELVLNAAVTEVRPGGGGHEIETSRGPLRATHLVNAAGLRSDEIDAMLGHSGFRVTPRRGELIVFDKLAGGLVNHVLLPVPTGKTKGVLVSPPVYGN